MKLKTTLLLTLLSLGAFAQSKSTGNVTLSTNMSANLTLNNTTSTVTLSLTGPNDRWFALQFGSFATPTPPATSGGGGMADGQDLVYWNNVTLVDAVHNGIGVPPTNDTSNNWTLVSNTNNTPANGQRTVVFTRAFNTGDPNDYVFNYANSDIDFAWARSGSANSYSLANHGGGNRGYVGNVATTLSLDKFSLNNAQVYPNPSNGDFNIKSETIITKVNVYTQTGAFVKTVEVENNADNAAINIKGLATGVYLIELVNDTEKSWKKVIVN
jgi:Secretion system C-terminal sorting domain